MEHTLIVNASHLSDDELLNLASELESVTGDSTKMRYPDRLIAPGIPHTHYSEEHAREAIDLAKKILQRARNFLTRNDVDL